ncbi:MAG: type II toxin-antitoxin system RelE/ParE family toxin [Trueperaceae bacterium]
MIEVRQTPQYQSWFDGLRDREARFRIVARVRRLSLGHFGDVRSVGGGVSELRIGSGPGYRVYFHREGFGAIVLLGGGDKSGQRRDITRAKALVRGL